MDIIQDFLRGHQAFCTYEFAVSGQDASKKIAGASNRDQQPNADESLLQAFANDSSMQICVCGGHDSEQWLATTDQFSLSKYATFLFNMNLHLAEWDVVFGLPFEHICYLFPGLWNSRLTAITLSAGSCGRSWFL